MESPCPYCCPGVGWIYQGRRISEEEAGRMCADAGIPYCGCSEGLENWAFLMVSDLAGASFIEGSDALLEELSEGDLLGLRREPENIHDHAAILVLDPRGKRIGYIPRALNRVPSNLLDSGRRLYAIVHDVSPERCTLRMFVFMEMPGHAVYRHFESFHDIGIRGIRIDAMPAGEWTALRDFDDLSERYTYHRSFG